MTIKTELKEQDILLDYFSIVTCAPTSYVSRERNRTVVFSSKELF